MITDGIAKVQKVIDWISLMKAAANIGKIRNAIRQKALIKPEYVYV